MPGDAADALLYSDVARGGLGIPHLSSLVPLMKQKRLESLLNSNDPLVRISTMEGVWHKDQKYWSAPPKIMGQEVRTTEEISRRWGKLRTGLHTGSDYVKTIAVSGTIKTPLRSSRGREQAASCELCNQLASLGHISQSCPVSHGIRVRRHDNVASFISGKLKTWQYQTVTEPRLTLGSSFRKPDLVVWDSGKASIIEVAVASDNYPLSRTWQAKFDK